jgi:hypothetical protein
MTHLRQTGWLERMALLTVPSPDDGRRLEDQSTPTDGRFSRAAAVRIGVAGVASVALGAVRLSPAFAQTRDECLTACFDRYAQAADRAIRVCKETYDDPKSVLRIDPGWAQWRALVDRGGWGFVRDLADAGLERACESKALHRMEDGFARCEDACRETCPQSGRSTSSAWSTCHGNNPPRPTTPPSPPPPGGGGGKGDPCEPCARVGGKCCYGSDPESLCACANPDYDCKEKYGCGA